MIKNTANQYITFGAIAIADGLPITTGTPVAYLTKDGNAQASAGNTAVHVGNGSWRLELSQAETNADHLSAVMTLTNAVNSFAQAFPLTLADFKADITTLATSAAVSALNDFNPVSDAVANVSLVSTCTTNSDMRGTDGANTTVPDNSGISANGVAIATLNDFDPTVDAVALVSVCTTNSDMRGTDSAATAANLAIVDGVVDANKIILDKVETGLILDGAVYQWTTNALENAPASGGSAPTASDIYTYFTTGSNEDAFKADVTLLATSAAVTALNDFDASSDTVANVSIVGTCTLNSDMRGTDAAATAAALLTVPKLNTAYTHTNQAADSMTVTIT